MKKLMNSYNSILVEAVICDLKGNHKKVILLSRNKSR